MKKISHKKIRFNIGKSFCFLGGLFLVFTLSFLLWNSFDPTNKVLAKESEKPLFSCSLEEYLNAGNLYTWADYSNTVGRTRAERLAVFSEYYYNRINSDVASSYNWPLLTSYDQKEQKMLHNLFAGFGSFFP